MRQFTMELKENQRPIAHLKTWYKIDAMIDTGDKNLIIRDSNGKLHVLVQSE